VKIEKNGILGKANFKRNLRRLSLQLSLISISEPLMN